jgi:hypothetical protein
MSKVQKKIEQCKELGLEYSKDIDCPGSFPCYDKRLRSCSNTKGEMLFHPFHGAKMFWTKAAYDSSKAFDPKTSRSKTRRGKRDKEYADERFKNLMNWTDGKSLPSIEPSSGPMKGLRSLGSQTGRRTKALRLVDKDIPIDEYVEEYYLEGIPESPSQRHNKGLDTMEERIAEAQASPTHQARLENVRREIQHERERNNRSRSNRGFISNLIFGKGTKKKRKRRKTTVKKRKRRKTTVKKKKNINPNDKLSRKNK